MIVQSILGKYMIVRGKRKVNFVNADYFLICNTLGEARGSGIKVLPPGDHILPPAEKYFAPRTEILCPQE